MVKILHIIASPKSASRTLLISRCFLEQLRELNKDIEIEEIDLAKIDLPPFWIEEDQATILLSPNLKSLQGTQSWNCVESLIQQFKKADVYLITCPMWNFSIPYHFKHYLDLIIQPHYMFKYQKDGSVIGLLQDKKMLIVTSRGSDYSMDLKHMDTQEPLLKNLFSFIGIKDVEFLHAEPMDSSSQKTKDVLEKTFDKAKLLAKNYCQP